MQTVRASVRSPEAIWFIRPNQADNVNQLGISGESRGGVITMVQPQVGQKERGLIAAISQDVAAMSPKPLPLARVVRVIYLNKFDLSFLFQ